MVKGKKTTKSSKTKDYKNPETFVLVLFSAMAFGLMYVFGTWAIDSGKILAYVLSFVGLYYGIHYAKEAVKNYLKDDKSTRASGSKRATVKK